jgi:hypothetical protein
MSKATKQDNATVTTIDDVPEAAPEVKAKEVEVIDQGGHFGGDKVELIVHAGEGEIGKQAVFVGINGHGFNVPRDVKVLVPREVADQLENCMQTVYESTESGGTREREVRRFALSIRELPARK